MHGPHPHAKARLTLGLPHHVEHEARRIGPIAARSPDLTGDQVTDMAALAMGRKAAPRSKLQIAGSTSKLLRATEVTADRAARQTGPARDLVGGNPTHLGDQGGGSGRRPIPARCRTEPRPPIRPYGQL